MVDAGAIRRRFKLIEQHLDERMRRLLVAADAEAVGSGGISAGARATGVSRRAIRLGALELKALWPPRRHLGNLMPPGRGVHPVQGRGTPPAPPRLDRHDGVDVIPRQQHPLRAFMPGLPPRAASGGGPFGRPVDGGRIRRGGA